MCGNELGGTSTGLWLGASMSYDRSNFLINVRATQGAGALYEKSRANDTEFGVVAYLYIEALSRGLRVSERRGFSKCGLNRGIVCDPAAPFGGMRQPGFSRERATKAARIPRHSIHLRELVSLGR